MHNSLRWAAVLLAAFLTLPATAQADRAAPADPESDVTVERDGEVYRFRVARPDGPFRSGRDGEGARFFRADTVIDGRHVIRFRASDGEGEVFEFEVPDFDSEALRLHRLPELERFRGMPPDLFFEHDGQPLGLRRLREEMDGLRFQEGFSEKTRREMMELERRAHALADEARRADGRTRADRERELEDVLGELFEARGRMREEQAAGLEERADELRREAEALREEVRDRERERRALIEERKRALLGERGTDW